MDDNLNWFLSETGRDRLLMLPGKEVPVVEALNEGIIVAAADNRILYANPAVEQLLGWRPEDRVEAPITMLVPERLRGADLAPFARYCASGRASIVGQPTRVPVPSYLSAGDGSIVNVPSVARYIPSSGESACGVSRAALSRWSHGLGVDLDGGRNRVKGTTPQSPVGTDRAE